jgi:preprotein translocase subunit SecE
MFKTYKEGQARLSRWIMVAIIIAMAGFGCYQLHYTFTGKITEPIPHIGFILGGEFPITPAKLISIGIFLVCLVGCFILYNHKKVVDFLVETETELRKVSWASKKEVISSSIVVIFTVLVLSFYIGLVDIVISKIKRDVPWDDLWSKIFGG